jgi:hypothetical protein
METSHARCASLRRGLSRGATLAMVNGLQVLRLFSLICKPLDFTDKIDVCDRSLADATSDQNWHSDAGRGGLDPVLYCKGCARDPGPATSGGSAWEPSIYHAAADRRSA